MSWRSCILPLSLLAVLVLVKSDLHGEAIHTLENPFLRLEFDAEKIGKVKSTVYKPSGVRLSGEFSSEASVSQIGQMAEVVGFKAVKSAGGTDATFETSLPANPLIGARPGSRTELPWFRHDDTTKLRLRKTYRLVADSPVCDVIYRVENTSQVAITFCLRFERRLNLPKTPLKSMVPTIEGVRTPSRGYFYDTPATWTARVGAGLAVVSNFEPATTSCLMPAGAITTEITLDAGASWTTTTRLSFLRGLGSIAESTQGIAADLLFPIPPDVPVRDPRLRTIEDEFAEAGDVGEVTEDGADGLKLELTRKAFLAGERIPFRLSLSSARIARLALKGTASLNLDSKTVELGTAKISLETGKTAVAPFTFTPPAPGTWIIRIEAAEDGKPVGVFEEALVVDYPTGFYLPGMAARKVKKVGKEFERFRLERFRRPGVYDQHSISFGMTEAIQNPHITYARPLAGGPLRALICMPFRRSREVIELKLRLEMQMDCVLVGGHGYRIPTATKKERGNEILRAPEDEVLAIKKALNKKPELIFFGATYWNWWLPDVQQEILRQVREGAGLILMPPIDLPYELKDLVEFHEHSKGVIVKHKGRIAVGPDPLFAGEEARMENVAREFVVAARGEPAVSLSWEPQDEITRAYSVSVENKAGKPFAGQIEVVANFNLPKSFPDAYRGSPYSIFDEVAKVSAQVTLKAGERKNLELAFPPVPTGEYLTFLFIKDKAGGTIDWRSKDQSAVSPFVMEDFKVTPVGGEKIRLGRSDVLEVEFVAVKKDEKLEGRTVAYIYGEDRSQRIVATESRPVELGAGRASVAFKVPLARALHRLFILRAGLRSNGLVVAEKRVPVMVGREPGRESKFRFTVLDNEDSFSYAHVQLDDQIQAWDPMPWAWVDMRGYIFGGYTGDPMALPWEVLEKLERAKEYREFEKTLPKLQVDLKSDLGIGIAEVDDLEALIEDEEEQAKEAAAKKKEPEKPIFIRRPCYNNPKLRALQFERACMAATEASGAWPQRILIADEYVYGTMNACQCEHCQKAFAKYVQRSYGTLERLNREWSTGFKGWHEAKLYDFDYEPKPPVRSQWPRALDTLTYKTVSLTDFCIDMSKEAKEIDPEIEFGFSGLYHMNIFNGTEFWRMSQVGDFHLVYRDTEEWQSFVGTEKAHSWSSGYGRNYNPSQQRHLPWSILFRGQWRLGHFTSQVYPMAGPDSRLHPGPKEFFKALDEVHSGYDELLLGHEVRDPIAIHWSGPSFFLCGLEEWERSQDSSKVGDIQRWCTHSIPWLGRRPYYLSYGMLDRGELGFWGTPRAVILQYSNAMSQRECDTLRKYVQNGGWLVAGVDTATRTEHGHPYETPPLDDVFGIRRTGGFQRVITPKDKEDRSNDITMTLPGEDEPMTFNAHFTGAPNIETTTAKPHGRWGTKERGGPVFIVNEFGKGRAIYMNFPLINTFGEARNRIAGWLYDAAKVRPFATARGCRLSRFRDGDAYYACLQVGHGYPQAYYDKVSRESNVTLQEKRHVYDARLGNYLGETDSFQPAFKDHSIAIYSCLPYRINRVKIQPPPQAKPGDIIRCDVSIEISREKHVRHVLRVSAIQPDGIPRKLLGCNIVTTNGRGQAEIPLAHNAPPGEWQLVVRDVATGTEARQNFIVRQTDDPTKAP